ncbi:fibrinogen-like protein 1 [Liolophura sinensis]|uniref:fibrinogen-like protein 1 n=1 Tax=Liolophura sinensis TaxID=3198878 RepID=UPI003158709A
MEESGDGFNCRVNWTHLESLIQNKVDQRLKDLKLHLESRVDEREFESHSRQTKRSRHNFHELRKEKLKALEFRMLKLSKDLEHTKLSVSKQTEALELSILLSRSHETTAKDISSKQTRLENAVTSLADRVAKLVKLLKQKHGKVLGNMTPVEKSSKANDAQVVTYPKDCSEVYRDMSKLFHGDFHITVKPKGAREPFTALCKVFNNTAWTVIQRRYNGSEDFYRTWSEYKSGFGVPESEFWIGNDNIYHLTKNGQMSLRIELEDWEGVKYHADYDHFSIGNEDKLFRLHVSGYHGNAGDSLTSTWESHDGQPFSTHDRDNDARFHDNCSEHYHGAWWFTSCFTSHLNGKYMQKENHKHYFVRNGIRWNTLHVYASLKSTVMMVAPREEGEL